MVQLSENEGIEGRTFVVTGGAGHVGSFLCLELARRGAAEVRSFDLCNSQERLALLKNHGVKCIVGELNVRLDCFNCVVRVLIFRVCSVLRLLEGSLKMRFARSVLQVPLILHLIPIDVAEAILLMRSNCLLDA